MFTETGAAQTVKTNQKAELKQQIPTFSNPANWMPSTKQWNLNGDVYAAMESVKCKAQTSRTFMDHETCKEVSWNDKYLEEYREEWRA